MESGSYYLRLHGSDIFDITDIPDAEIGDTVTLIGPFGGEKIDAFDMEKLTENSYVVHLRNISERPVRIYRDRTMITV